MKSRFDTKAVFLADELLFYRQGSRQTVFYDNGNS